MSKLYKRAWYSYGLPVVLSFIGTLSSFHFVLVAILLAVPTGVVGLVFSIKGFRLARQNNDREQRDVGYANLLLGGVIVGVGVVVLGFGYLWVSG